MNQTEKAKAFRALHERDGAFVIPNPWDAGSAKLLAALGFEALATTSWGFAVAQGRRDGAMTLEEMLVHCRDLSAATELPLSADFENGFADDAADVARNVLRVAETGIAGCSVEDHRKDEANPIYDFTHSVERVRAAVEAVRSLPFPFTLTARADNYFWGRDDLDDTIRRLQAFENAGADVLYAPGLTTLEEVKTVTAAVRKPVNVLAPPLKGVTVAQLAAAGAKRISVGGALTQAAIAAVVRAGREMLDAGSFDWLAELLPAAERNRLFERGGFFRSDP